MSITLSTLSAGIAFAMDVGPLVKKAVETVGSVMETVETVYRDSTASGATKKELAMKLLEVAVAAIGAAIPGLMDLLSSIIDKVKDFYNLITGNAVVAAAA